MKFVCDSCHAQYMISDDKVGANGVKVRCKKCSNVIVVKRVAEPDATSVMQNPLTTDPGAGPSAGGANAPFGGIGLDEIGQAFDSVLAGGDPAPAGGGAANPFNALTGEGNSDSPIAASGSKAGDFDATSVMNLKELAGLTAQAETSKQLPDGLKADAMLNGRSGSANGHVNGKTNGASSGEVPLTDWYVAIDEEQKGPVNLEFVKKAWEEGKVTTDSLVWRNGYPDWIPLSTVADLVKVLTPIAVPRKSSISPVPADADKPAGATATGNQMPWNGGAAQSAVHDPDAVDWKPAAASALASLVQEEMAALTKPTPKKTEEPIGVGEGTRPRAKGLLDLAEEPVPSKSALADEPASQRGLMGDSVPVLAAAPPGSALNDMHPEPMVRQIPQGPSNPEIEVRSPRLPATRPPSDSQRYDRDEVPEYPARAAYVPPRQERQSSDAKYIVGGIVALCITGVVIAWMFKPAPTPPQEVADARPTPAPAPSPSPTPAPTRAPVVAAPATPTPAPAPAPAPAPVAVKSPAPSPPAALAPAATPAPVAVAAKSSAEDEGEGTGRHRHHKTGHHKAGGGGGDEAEPTGEPAAPAPAPEPPPAKASPPPKTEDMLDTKHKSKVDDDFDKLLGGGSSPSSDAPAPATKKPKKETVYIPGDMASNLPAQLAPGDIMSVVAGHKDNIKKCSASDPDLSGTKVVMHWTISPSGSTTGVKCNTAEAATSPGTKCLSREIKQWKFPQFSGAPMPIDFPFKF